MERSAITVASYNPRRPLTDSERRRLRALLKNHGLFNALVWNRKTGNLVAGHQRLAILDALEGGKAYALDVDVVDVDEKKEREMNIAHNNANAGGDFDLAKLGDLFKDGALDIESTGFDSADLYRLFGDSPLLAHDGAVEELAKKLREASEVYAKIREKSGKRDSQRFFTILVWRDEAAMDAAHAAWGLDDNRYQSGADMLARMDVRNSESSS